MTTGHYTNLIHADDGIESFSDVAPPIHLSATYSYTSSNEVQDAVYSRMDIPTVQRCEAVLEQILDAPSVTYCSGLSAIFGLLTYLNPKRIYIERAERGGYHGTLGVAEIIKRLNGAEMFKLDELDRDVSKLDSGDVVWLETPLNPTGEVTDISRYSRIAKQNGAVLCVDATFAPPPLQDPFLHGADYVMHSATKYLGGHSDLLAGVVASRNTRAIESMRHDRIFLGSIMSGHTAWLLLRSLRTFRLRVERQAKSALQLVTRLHDLAAADSTPLLKVVHSSLQSAPFVSEQMTGGHSPTFAIYLKDEASAAALPSKLKYFHHATSLGGVESLAEWRSMSDPKCDRRLIRISVGIEDVDDLYNDLEEALHSLS
ncbi:hypothetical protein MRB53_039131 [Persea americana]|nr:hypothetical protein MRB53_039131 [Persea americana]